MNSAAGDLTRLTAALEKVLPAIDDAYAAVYCAHIRDMAVLTADSMSLREKQSSDTTPGGRSRARPPLLGQGIQHY
ncbi:hypothetical protein [Streptomyces blastmyceticus]|uniref:Transposase n=1 Tax=Streptomyces blastmyceticus TaxID=68180 RepID=A0ABP3HTZ8_9ACTN